MEHQMPQNFHEQCNIREDKNPFNRVTEGGKKKNKTNCQTLKLLLSGDATAVPVTQNQLFN